MLLALDQLKFILKIDWHASFSFNCLSLDLDCPPEAREARPQSGTLEVVEPLGGGPVVTGSVPSQGTWDAGSFLLSCCSVAQDASGSASSCTLL